MKFTSKPVGICSKIAVHTSKIGAANEQDDNRADIGESKQRILFAIGGKGEVGSCGIRKITLCKS